MSDSPDKAAAAALFGRVQPDDGPMLPRVREARERNRRAREAVRRGESLAEVEIRARLGESAVDLLRRLPSKAVLERRFPKLAVNRMTGRWMDGETGARGDDLESLLACLGKRSRARGKK